MDDISNLKELVSRYMVNHFVIGYFALFIIYGDCFTSKSLLFQVTMAIVASYLLFLPARLIIRLKYGEREDDNPDTIDRMERKRKILKFYHLRIFSAFLFLATFYFIPVSREIIIKIISIIPWPENVRIHIAIFALIIISDCFAYKFTKWTHEPGLKNRIKNKLIQWFDP